MASEGSALGTGKEELDLEDMLQHLDLEDEELVYVVGVEEVQEFSQIARVVSYWEDDHKQDLQRLGPGHLGATFHCSEILWWCWEYPIKLWRKLQPYYL